MFKRETRFKGQKRVCVGRVTRNSEPMETRSKDSSRDSSCEDSSRIVKCETSFNDAMDTAASNVQQVSELLHVACCLNRPLASWKATLVHYL